MTGKMPRILAIDDTPANLMTLCSVLEDSFDLQFATSGKAGLALALEAPPELILLDIMMPELDGFETCRLLKMEPRLQNVPVIFITALTDLESQLIGLSMGAADYITKPINVSIARQRIRNLVEREQLRAEVEQQRDALETTLKEKVGLLYEIHHRVKNNLQVISSLLRLEAARAVHPDTASALGEMQGRIRAMALLHETLYRTGASAEIDLAAYLRNLSEQVFRTMNTRGGSIRLVTDLTPVKVSIEQATPCGLMVNELISNCLKHGFPDGHRGEVMVELRPVNDGGQMLLCVSDTGIGMAKIVPAQQLTTLGLQLVSDMVKQLGGTAEMESVSGTRFSMTFTRACPRAALEVP
jgi:two-component sensor histidine kinase/CheY-like chemotaxis protein